MFFFLFDEIIKCEVNTIVIDENNDVYVKFGKCDNGVCPAKIYSWEFGRKAFFLRKRQKKNKKAKSDHNISSIKLRKFRWSSFKE